MVNPSVTETNAPNDTLALAIEVNTEIIGESNSDDQDYWKFAIPANNAYRISLKNAVDLTGTESLDASYSSSFYNSVGNSISSTSTNRLEGAKSNTPQTINVRVSSWRSQNDTPYQLTLELFP